MGNTVSQDATNNAAALATIICAALILDDDADDTGEEADELPEANDMEMMIRDELTSTGKRQHDDEDGVYPRSKRQYVRYDRERALRCIMDDWLGPHPTFADRQFERVFRISRTRAEWILQRLARADPFWTQTFDCCNRMSNAPEVKFLAALKMAAYGESFVAWKDYFQLGDSTARECFLKLMRELVLNPEISSEFLRSMTKHDARVIEQRHYDVHGVHGMLGSLDVNQILWGNCPHEQKGQHCGRLGVPTLALEAAIDYNLWIWHWCFGHPGTLNDSNVWERSSLLNAITHGKMHEIDFEFEINGEKFSMLFWLVDLIYPRIACFLRSIPAPTTKIDHLFADKQEGWRKDAERGFGVLEKKFHCNVHPIQLWFVDDIHYQVGGTIVLHNMMVKERVERGEEENACYYDLVSDHNSPSGDASVLKTAAAESAIEREDARFQEQVCVLAKVSG